MRLTPISLASMYKVRGSSPKTGRGLTIQPFPYNGVLPLSLRNKVSPEGEKSRSVPCIYEISSLLACLKENDFKEAMCLKQALELNNCNQNFLDTTKTRKQQEKKGVLVPKATKFSSPQLNILLKKIPQPDVDS